MVQQSPNLFGLRPLDFGLLSAFDLRISDFRTHLLANRGSCPYLGAAKFKYVMKRRVIYGVLTVALTVNLLIGARIFLNSAQAAEKDSVYPSMELFSYVMERVRKDYVDGKNLTYQELVYGALKGMLSTLDPFTVYVPPANEKAFNQALEGNYEGVGIQLNQLPDGRAPLICTHGQPGAAVMHLLRALASAGAQLRYHGDFDWPGLRIGNHIVREYGAMPWRYGAADYGAAVQSAPQPGRPLGAQEVAASWDDGLAPLMRTHNLTIAEEAVADSLLEDLV